MSDTQHPKYKSSFPAGENSDPDNASAICSPPPIVDLNRLNAWSDDSIRQIILDARIKRSRISKEMAELNKIIDKVKNELLVCLGRYQFYDIIAADLLTFLKERQAWRRKTQITPPAKNSRQ